MLNENHVLYVFKDAQPASFMTLTQRLITRCTLQPSQAQRLFSCSLGVKKHVQTEHLLSPPPRMFKDLIDLSILKDAKPGFLSQSVVAEVVPHRDLYFITISSQTNHE